MFHFLPVYMNKKGDRGFMDLWENKEAKTKFTCFSKALETVMLWSFKAYFDTLLEYLTIPTTSSVLLVRYQTTRSYFTLLPYCIHNRRKWLTTAYELSCLWYRGHCWVFACQYRNLHVLERRVCLYGSIQTLGSSKCFSEN